MEESSQKILEVKKQFSTTLYDKLPPCFQQYSASVASLTFKETPDYQSLRSIFGACAIESQLDKKSLDFDWCSGVEKRVFTMLEPSECIKDKKDDVE